MSHGIKKAQDEYKGSTLLQEVIDKHDADKINDTVNALIGCDAAKAREIIKKPLTLMPLVTNRRNNTSCLYAMHALMVPLMSENCSDILNEMSNADIAILKSCISAAQKYIAPDENGVKSEIARRSEEQETGKVKTGKDTTRPLKIEERKTNARMLKSLTVTQQVADSTLWPTCVAELHKWYKAIDEFKRDETKKPVQQPAHNTSYDINTLWTLSELAQKMNDAGLECDKTQIYNHIYRIMDKKDSDSTKTQIKTWFILDSNPKKFKAAYFEEYKTLFGSIRSYVRKVQPSAKTPIIKATQEKSNKQTVVVKKKSNIKTTDTVQKNEQKSLLNLRALEAYLNKLTALFEAATKRAKTATKHANAAMQRALVEKDLQKRNDLIKEADKHNTIATHANNTRSSIAAKINDANALLKERDEALTALQNADKKIADIVAKHNVRKK